MRQSTAASVRTGVRSTLAAATVRALPLTQYTPLSKWMAVSLLTVQQLDPSRR